MQLIYHAILSLSDFMRPYTPQIALSLASTILFLYGAHIHNVVKDMIKDMPFVVRVMILVLVCAFAYGTLGFAFTKLCEAGLRLLDGLYLAPVVIALFFLIGLLAERKKAI